MGLTAYIIRCVFMLLVTWAAIRGIGKKSIANMTSYDLAAIMLLTTVAAEPLVYKVSSKATVGVIVITVVTLLIGSLSLKKFFYNVDSRPFIVVADGIIQEKELKQARMNVPLLMSELRLKGFQNISDVKYAIIEPSGKLSVLPSSQARPVQPSDLAIQPSPVSLSFPLIIDGEIEHHNLAFLQKNKDWLMNQLKAFSVNNIDEVLFAQMDGQGKLHVINKNKRVEIPKIN